MNKTLNKNQQALIDTLNSNIMLIASAGTGKTEVLTKRISKIIKENLASPSEILCITFTNKACKEMKDRIEKEIHQDHHLINIKTFHSFCFDIIKQEIKQGKLDISSDFTVFDEDDCKELLKLIDRKDVGITILQKFINLVKDFLINEDCLNDTINYKEVILRLFQKNRLKIEQICQINYQLSSNLMDEFLLNGDKYFLEYNHLLKENHALDFNDLIYYTKKLFDNPILVERLGQRYKYISIDEVQDTSQVEYKIIEKIFKKNNILICGDFFQRIYEWRGANPLLIFEHFKKNYNPIEIVFEKNYRATQTLTNASIDYLKTTFPELLDKFSLNAICADCKQQGENIFVKNCNDISQECKYIFEELQYLSNIGVDLSKVAILARDNNYTIELSKELAKLNASDKKIFDFLLVDDFKFFRRSEIKDILAFLKLIVNKNDNVSLLRILKRFPTNIGPATINTVNSLEYKELGINICDFIDSKTISHNDKYGILLDAFEQENIVIFDVESTGTDPSSDEIIQIAAIKLNKQGEPIQTFNKLIRNTKPVGSSVYVHGFSDQYLLENGLDKKQVLEDFLSFSNGCVIVGHNVSFDLSILNKELSKLNMEKANFLANYDTLEIYRKYYPQLENHKLATISSFIGSMTKPDHDAYNDILATSEILLFSLKNNIIPSTLQRMTYTSKILYAFRDFNEKMQMLFLEAENLRPHQIVKYIIDNFNVLDLYRNKAGDFSDIRMRLVKLYDIFDNLEDKKKDTHSSLIDMLKITTLSNGDIEETMNFRGKIPKIPIITIHQSKGLEYSHVFLCGLNEGIFPSYLSKKYNSLQEEKRLFYVAITRAKEKLYLSHTAYNKKHKHNEKSQLIDLINKNYLN